MKYKILIISFLFVLTGCVNIPIFNDNNKVLEKKIDSQIINDNYAVTGVVKFNIQDRNISSRFKFIRKNEKEKINFLDMFNSEIVSFGIKDNNINVENNKKNKKSEELKKIVNRPIFKKIFINFSSILSQNLKYPKYIERYENGLYKIIRNESFLVYYLSYNTKKLPKNINVEYLNILFNIRINSWEFIKE